MKFLAIATALATVAVAADVAASGAAGAPVTQIGDGQVQVGTEPAGQQPTPQPAPDTPGTPGTPAPADSAPAPLVSCEPSNPGGPGVRPGTSGSATVLPPPLGTGSATGSGISPINTQPVVAGAGRIAGGAVAAVAVAVALL
ncbi:hypothetical protein MY10362_008154 [Beauveria mimosiformis]